MTANIFLDMPGGLKMPVLGLGTFLCNDEKELENALNVALEAGYRHIDTAFAYKNEAIIGRVLKEWFTSGKLKREDVFITTKLPTVGVNENRVEMFMKKSLENLQLDYVDLYLIHFPIGFKYVEGETALKFTMADTEKTDHLAIWKKMEEQVDAGRTKTIGLSNFNIRQIDKIVKAARIKPSCLQVQLHVHLQQPDLVHYSQKNGLAVVSYFTLGAPGFNKFLVETGRKEVVLPDILHNTTIAHIGKQYKKTNAQIVLRYFIQKNIAVIPKSVTSSRIKENINVFDFFLDAEDLKTLEGLEIGEDARIATSLRGSELAGHPEWPYAK